MIQQLIEQIIKKNEKLTLVLATVTEVKATSFNAKREGAADLLNVRLNSVLTEVENVVLIVPKVGSVVLCGIIENNTASAILISCSEVEKVEIELSGLEFKMSQGKFTFKNQITDLKDILTNSLNAIKSATIPTPTGGVGALDPAAQTLITTEVNKLNQLFN